jgi:hypothetical protein
MPFDVLANIIKSTPMKADETAYTQQEIDALAPKEHQFADPYLERLAADNPTVTPEPKPANPLDDPLVASMKKLQQANPNMYGGTMQGAIQYAKDMQASQQLGVPVNSERGQELAAVQANIDATKEALKAVPGNINTAQTRAAQEYLVGAEEYAKKLRDYVSDDEYRADKAANAAAIEQQQRRENLDPTEAAYQLDELKRQYEETKRIFASTNPDDLIVDTSEKLARRDEILDNYERQIRQLEADLTARQNETRYSNLMRLPDFEQNSQYVPHERVSTNAVRDPSGEGIYNEKDVLYEAVNGNQTAVNQYNRITNDNGKYDGLRYITDEERKIYNYLYNRDMQSADSLVRDDPETHGESGKYLNEILPTLNARMRAAKEEEARQYAKEHPILASLGTVVASPLKAASYASQLGELASTGKIDQNAAGSAYSYMNSAMRGTVAREVERNWGKPGSFAYNTAMSMADNLWQMFITGGPAGEGAMLAIMGMGAAADAVIAAKDRGLTDAQAFALGTATGAIEAVTEKIGFDNLYTNALKGSNALKEILRQTLAEGSEEFLGSTLDNLADMIIAGMDSEHYKRVRELVASGMSEKDAVRKAWGEDFGEAGMEALSGAISGMLMSGGGRAIQSAFSGISRRAAENDMQKLRNAGYGEFGSEYMARQNAQTEQTTSPNAPNAPSTQIAPQMTNDTAETENAAEGRTEPPAASVPNNAAATEQTDEQIAATLDPEAGEVGGVNYSVTDNDNGTWNAVVENPETGEMEEMRGSYESADPLVKVVQAAKAMGATMPNDVLTSALTGAQNNTIGAAQTGYNYADMPHEQKVSRQYYTTDRYSNEKGAAREGSPARYAYRQAFTYETRSREESMARARDELFVVQDGKEVFLGDLDPQYTQDVMNDLRAFPAWNDVMTNMAKIIEDHLLAKSLEARVSGTKEQAKAARQAYTNWQSIVQDRVRAGARGMNVLNDWSGVGNENGLRTELGAIEAVKQNDKLTDEEKSNLVDEIQNYMDEIRGAQTQGDLIDIILRIGNRRGTVTNPVMEKIVRENLKLLTLDQVKQAAFSSASMLAFDTTPVGALQRVKTVQVLNMLSNPKTAATNVLSNSAFYLLDKLAMRGSALVDAILENVTGTRSVAWEDAVSKDMLNEMRTAAAKSIAEIALDIDMGGEGKYNPTGTRNFRASGNFAEKAMSIWERNSNFTLITPDEVAKAATRGSTARSINRLAEQGRIRSENENYAEDYQNDLAKYRTFQNERIMSGLTKGLHDVFNLISYSTIEQMRNGVSWKNLKPADFGLGDFVAPFSKIGGNLVGVALDYSPAKLLTGIGQLIELGYKEIRAELTGSARTTAEQQRRVVQNLGRGFTGTLLTLALMSLASAGIIRRAKEDDKEATALNKAQGRYGTQINMSALGRLIKGGNAEWQDGDRLYDLSRFEPFNFFTDLALMLNEDTTGAEDLVSYVGGAGQAILESFGNNISDMPVFQSVGNFLDSTNYGDKWYEAALKSLGKTGVSSATPNILAAFAKGIDDKQRDLYTRDVDGDTLVNAIKSAAGESFDFLKSRIPGVRETLPTKTAVTGEPLENPGNTAQRLLNAMLNPLGTNRFSQTEASAELERVRNATGDASFYPKTRQPSKLEYTYKGEKTTRELSYDERQEFQQTYSDLYWDVADDLAKNPNYKRLTDEQKAKVLGYLQNYAYQYAKYKFLGKNAVDKWIYSTSRGNIVSTLLGKVK